MDSKLKCSFEMPSVEQLLESKNIHEDAVSIRINLIWFSIKIFNNYIFLKQTAVCEVNAETELQNVATEVKELREEENTLRQENIKLKVRYY